jgi:hypothetical protein
VTAALGAVLPGRTGDLADLREHWGIAYVINVTDVAAGERWTAERVDDHQILTAASPGELLIAIRVDYGDRPVPRWER